jgi:gamma-glutamylcyclotransferase (GGCT)/AIG2-like uncharacterized protein YtfP
MTQQLPMFVFGTLRYGESNHFLLEERYDKRLTAQLSGYSRVQSDLGFPMIDRKEDEQVSGELYFLTDERYDQTMTELDELEMLPPGELIGEWYQRITVTVSTPEGDFTAWAYVKPQS